MENTRPGTAGRGSSVQPPSGPASHGTRRPVALSVWRTCRPSGVNAGANAPTDTFGFRLVLTVAGTA